MGKEEPNKEIDTSVQREWNWSGGVEKKEEERNFFSWDENGKKGERIAMGLYWVTILGILCGTIMEYRSIAVIAMLMQLGVMVWLGLGYIPMGRYVVSGMCEWCCKRMLS